MATNHNRTLYKDYLSALLGKEAAEEQVRILNAQCHNGKNEVDALIHLCVGAPYSVGDLFGMVGCEQ